MHINMRSSRKQKFSEKYPDFLLFDKQTHFVCMSIKNADIRLTAGSLYELAEKINNLNKKQNGTIQEKIQKTLW